MPNGAGSLRCSPATGSSISRRCRSMPNCSMRASICVRCPRCIGCWHRTRWSPNAAGWRGTQHSVPGVGRDRAPAGVQLGHHQARGPGEGHLFRCVRDDRHLFPLPRRCSRPCPRVRCSGKGTDGADLVGAWRPQVVHADRGTSMTSKTVAALLADLEVTRSHSRPRVSNDNPYSESLFKTLKYGPAFPERFGSLCEARQFMDTFTDWYNHEHRHTGIGLHTPADVHFGLATDKAADRRTVLTHARARHPHRFGTIGTPKILDLPDTAWINRPAQNTTQETATTAA